MELAGVFQRYSDSGPAAMALCILIDGATFASLGINGGTASVVVHTLDRYWKFVHATHHRKYYRRWMLYAGVFLPWLNGAAMHLMPAIGTSRIVNGNCHRIAFWPSTAMEKVRHFLFHHFIGNLTLFCSRFAIFARLYLFGNEIYILLNVTF